MLPEAPCLCVIHWLPGCLTWDPKPRHWLASAWVCWVFLLLSAAKITSTFFNTGHHLFAGERGMQMVPPPTWPEKDIPRGPGQDVPHTLSSTPLSGQDLGRMYSHTPPSLSCAGADPEVLLGGGANPYGGVPTQYFRDCVWLIRTQLIWSST